MITKKQELVMKLMDRGSFKNRPNLLVAALSTPVYESYRNFGYTPKRAIMSAKKVAKMTERYGNNYEGAVKAYKDVLDSLGPERFSRFIKNELEEVFSPYTTAGIRMRASRYAPTKGLNSGRPSEDFPQYSDRSDELLGGETQRAYLEGMCRTSEDEEVK